MSFVQDVRFSLRMMAKNLGFTTVAVVTLALGIGAVTAIFSVVNAVMLRPLPYPNSDRLVQIYTQFPTMNFDRFWFSPPEYDDVQKQAASFESVGAWNVNGIDISGTDRPIRAVAAQATASLWPTLGVAPALGRTYVTDEDQPGDPQVVVIGHNLWRRAFAGDKEIVGRTIYVDAVKVTIIGVMPPGFDFPGEGVEMWVPIGLDLPKSNRGNHFLSVIGRLKPGVGIDQARAEMATLQARWKPLGRHALNGEGHRVVMQGLKDEIVGSVRWALWMLQAAVLFVLLIACANVSNLLLARAEQRTREIAIRTALGADRARLVRQFLTESVVLGLIGGALGMLFAVWGLDAAVSLIPEGAPRATEIHLDRGVLLFGVGCSLFTSFLFGLAPILHTRVVDLGATLKEGRSSTAGASRQRFRRALIVAEVALSIVLVIGCGLMVRSFARLEKVNTGFRPDGLLTAELQIPQKTYATDAVQIDFWKRLGDELKTLPGVTSATLMTGLPPNRRIDANDCRFEGVMPTKDGPPQNVDFWQIAGDGYFDTMGIHLVEGRWFDSRDGAGAPGVVIVNETMARRFWPNQSPIGKRIDVAPRRDKDPHWETVVGVVADVKQQGLSNPTGTEVYIPVAQTPEDAGGAPQLMYLVVRAAGDPKSLAPSLRNVVARLDATLPLGKIRTMDQVMWEAVARPRFLTFLFVMFGAIALALAAVGIYGVMAYSVERRTHELGIRMALGAQASGVRWLVLRQGLGLVLAGVAAGVAAAVALSVLLGKILAGLLFDVHALDPVTFAAVSVLVVAVAWLACWIPALRATRVDPMIALRNE